MATFGKSGTAEPYVYGVAGEAIVNGQFKAVKFNDKGEIVLCSAGDDILGVLIAQTDDALAAGDELTIQVSGQAPAKAGGAIAAGDLVGTDANGEFVKATSGKALGYALAAAQKGQTVLVSIDRQTVSVS